MSWISLDDLVAIINFEMENEESIEGAVNVCFAQPRDKRGVYKNAGRGDPPADIPAAAEIRGRSDDGRDGRRIVARQRARRSEKLEKAGYEFKFTELKPALENAVK